jgi:hypothetical protein
MTAEELTRLDHDLAIIEQTIRLMIVIDPALMYVAAVESRRALLNESKQI